MNHNEVFELPSFDPVVDKYRVDTFAARTPQSSSRSHAIDSMRKPSWLLGLGKNTGGGAGGYLNNTPSKEVQPQQEQSGKPLSGSSHPHGGIGGGLGYLEGGLRR